MAVSAENNPQMKLYTLGAIAKYGFLYPIKTVKMAIVQPRIDNFSVCEMPAGEIQMWGNTIVKVQAEKAFKGEGDFVQGEHCRFCRAKGACEFRARENIKVVEEIRKKQITGILNNTELADILSKTEGISDWIRDVNSYALDEILKGEQVPGWKAVEGKSNRKIVDIDKAFEILKESGINEALLYERKPATITQLEKVVGKKELTETIGDYIEKPKGSPTLVKESDKRENYKTSTAKEEFANIKNLEEEN